MTAAPSDKTLLALFQPGLLAGKRALITGGGTGIGFATARLLGRLGAKVLIAARRKEVLQTAEAALQAEGIAASSQALNIRDLQSVEALFTDLEAAERLPDLLINNAGGQFPAPAAEISPNGFRAVFDLNVQGNWQMSHGYAKRLIAAGRGGRIINIVFGHTGPIPYFAHAQAARAAIVNLTKTLALEWGQKGILVNAVGPGAIRTGALEDYSRDQGWSDPTRRLPVPRMGTAMEVAAAG
ncbi:MAG: SDR family NAD(P)-dependent oxidoreductase [Pseudomonadota bacterium]